MLGFCFWLFAKRKMWSGCVGYELMINCGYCGMRIGQCWGEENCKWGIGVSVWVVEKKGGYFSR